MLQSVRELGREEGREKGIKEGIKERTEFAAKNLLRYGWLTPDQISKATGLKMNRIRELQKEITGSVFESEPLSH